MRNDNAATTTNNDGHHPGRNAGGHRIPDYSERDCRQQCHVFGNCIRNACAGHLERSRERLQRCLLWNDQFDRRLYSPGDCAESRTSDHRRDACRR